MKAIFSLACFLFLVCVFSAEGRSAAPVAASPAGELGAVIDALLGDDVEAVDQAHAALLEKGRPATPALHARLEQASGESAYRLILTLSRIGDPASTEVFRRVWEESPEVEVKLAAAMALCRMNVEFDLFLDFIKQQVQQGDEGQRLEAMQMLGYIADARVVPLLKEIFYDRKQTDFIHQAAIWGLAHIPLPESARVLVEMLADPEVDWFYKEIILTAIRFLAQEESLVAVVSDELEKIQRLSPPSASSRP